MEEKDMKEDLKEDILSTIIKGIALFISIFVICFFLESCNKNDKAAAVVQDGFVIISDYIAENSLRQCIMYDPETYVMYLYVSRGSNGGISVMYNADGTPKLYTPSPNSETDNN